MEKEEQQKVDERYMRRALQLARCGAAGAPPNPMVGAVVVAQGRIIGEGYHQRCGQAHAEVNAIASVRQRELLRESTIYVTLEPCAHYGKTPPCADLIVETGIPRVVVGCRDSFDQVDGKGIQKLRAAGCQVTVGVLEDDCLQLNRAFFTFHQKKRPYVTLKWAQSADGFVDICRTASDGKKPAQFSTPLTQTLMHGLRAHSDAILVGARTALLDNPSLTTRCWPGKDALRVVLDPRGTLPQTLCLYSDGRPTLTYGAEPLHEVLRDLHARGVQRLMVEGGSSTIAQFLTAELWDEARVEIAPFALGDGVAAPQLPPAARLLSADVVEANRILRYARAEA